MRKILFLICGLLLVNARSTFAQSTTAWTGYYFTNPNLQGNPALVRDDANIDFVWGNASPAPGIPADNFSARWTRWVYLDVPGNWTFVVTMDDGARLFVDDQLVIDAWQDQQTTTRSITLNLTQAFHLVRMEYYDRSGNAQAQLQILSANFPDWRGEYFNNPTLSGAPAFARNDGALNFNFGAAGPGGGIAADKFSARWTRNVYFRAGRYRFSTRTHDGVRLWVDNQLVVDRWRDQRVTTWTGEITLAEGDHLIKMEYYNASGAGIASLTWSAISGGAEIWRGEYFDNAGLTGASAFTRDDAAINFNWGNTSPGAGVSGPNWSVRWTTKRAITLPSYYTVTATADDGVRVWVDNNLLIDEWHDQSPTVYAALVYLNSGAHDWRVEYYNHGGIAAIAAQITPGAVAPDAPASSNPATGDIAVDTKSAYFVRSSTDAAWQTAPNGYGGTAFALKNNPFAHAESKWARWYAPLPRPGLYDVAVYIPANIGTTRGARYHIAHASAYDWRALDQTLYANQWVSVGVYYFSATGDEYVALSDATFESARATTIVVDAVRFSAR
ncbi:MAG: PA14 domain-containing protein [Anaerolineales bacterium]|nr:PA14 domain-containing protein [Anaerolineales bacterium]